MAIPAWSCEGGCKCGGASSTEPLADQGRIILRITPHTLNALMNNGPLVRLLEIHSAPASGPAWIPGGRVVLASAPEDILASEAGPLDGFVVLYPDPVDSTMSVKPVRNRLQAMNYQTVIEFAGGSAAWHGAGFPLNSR